MLRNRARDLARHADGTVKLSKARLKYYEGQLGELGIDSNAAINWYRSSIDSSGQFNPNRARGLFTPKNKQEALLQATQQDFYKQNILGGANRFTKELFLTQVLQKLTDHCGFLVLLVLCLPSLLVILLYLTILF